MSSFFESLQARLRESHLLDLWNYLVRFIYRAALFAGFPLCIYWMFRLPSVGVAIGLLGTIGLIVALRGDSVSTLHKAFWAFMAVLLL